VNATSGKRIRLQVNSSDTIDDIKVKIYEVDGTRPIQQRLLYYGMMMQDHRTLADYNVEKEDTLDMNPCLCGC
jgi:ubiquitin C